MGRTENQSYNTLTEEARSSEVNIFARPKSPAPNILEQIAIPLKHNDVLEPN